MNVTLSIDSNESIEIAHADLASIVSWFPDDSRHAIFFSRLCDHPASEVRSAVAGMKYMDTDVLERLARDTSIEVVRHVANNKRALKMFKTSLIEEMINRDVSIAVDIADNLSMVLADARDDVIMILLKHPDPKVVETVLNYDNPDDKTWTDDTD